MGGFVKWLYDLFGLNSANSPWYLFWSGGGAILVAWAASMTIIWWRTSCKATWWCPLHGDHELTDPASGVSRKMCWAHHPGIDRQHLGSKRLAQLRRDWHLYVGKRPGPG